ncbi:MAG: SelB C-terminal domain-containing protein, partial [Thermoguttaceae bacterium]
NVTGEGFDAFLTALEQVVRSVPPRPSDGLFRLPLDRAFSAKGFGAVAAGIPVAGFASLGDEVVLLPQGATSRIRRIEVYGQPSNTVLAGQCAAINLGHCDLHQVGRGDVLTLPGYFTAEEYFVCQFRLLRRENAKTPLRNGGEVKFHTGTSEVNATLYLLEPSDDATSGDPCLIQVRVKRPIVAGPGDPFILRTLSPVRTIGGGRIVEAVDRRLKRNRPGLIEDLRQRAAAVADPARFVEYAVRNATEAAIGAAGLAKRTKLPAGRIDGILTELLRRQTVIAIGGSLYMHRVTAAEAGQKLLDRLTDYHGQSPESPGMTAEQLRQAGGWSKPVFDAVVALLKSDGRLTEQNQRLAVAGHRATFGGEEAAQCDQIESQFLRRLFAPPSLAEVAAETGLPAAKLGQLVRILQEHQRLVLVADGMLFHGDAIDRARALLIAHLQAKGRLDSVDFKYLLDTTRKFALPLLDYFDRVGLLRRVGNTRFLKSKPSSGSS